MNTISTSPDALPARLLFGHFELRPHERTLLAEGQAVPLGGRAFDLLLALICRSDRVVPRNELIEAVWPGRVVEENNLSVQVNTLRKALGGQWLLTVPGRGYRFTGALPAHSPPAADTTAPALAARKHLPVAQPLLIGRSEDLAALGTLVDQHRLVTLVGAGGIGKTRLAQALLHLRTTAYAQSVCWVVLSDVNDAAGLIGAVATALGVRTTGSGGDDLAQALSGLQMLVALDNAEHLLDDVTQLVRTLLDAAPGLRLLVTSQAPLRLPEERVLRLAGLSLPQGPLPALQAQSFGAVALFAERAQAADSRFVLTDAQVPGVIELCRHLDGLPLAIELAASRLPLLGLDALLAAMPARLKVLTGNRDRTAPPRQQTLRAAVQWSHDLLGPREQRLFRRLGALAGSSPLAVVQAVGQAPGDEDAGDPWSVLDALDELVQRSLVELNIQHTAHLGGFGGAFAAAGETRYRLLESPRALAQERLAASGEIDTVRERHARAVLQRLDEAEAALEDGHLGVEAWRCEIEADLDNAREALAHADRTGDRWLALNLASALLPSLPAPLHAERLALADRLEALLAGEDDPALRRRGWMALGVGLVGSRPARSRHAALQALVEARSLAVDGDRERWHLVQALCGAAGVAADPQDAQRAQPLLDEALALQRPDWPPVRLRATARVRATIATACGRVDAARDGYREFLALSRAAGDPSLVAQINLADIELWAGDAQAAVAMGRSLVAVLVTQRDEKHLAVARLNLACACLAIDDVTQAQAQLQASWAAAQRVQRLSWWCNHAALLAALQGRFEAAAQLLGAASAHYEATQDRRQVNEAREYDRALALCAAAIGGPALQRWQDAGRDLPDEVLAALLPPEA